MTAKRWRKKIKDATQQAGTYMPCFDAIINILADILERRDKAIEQYQATGANPVVRHTNKGGATNIEKNPILLVILDTEKTALPYWRDLGLTPAGLKKINEDAMNPQEEAGGLEAVLANIGL